MLRVIRGALACATLSMALSPNLLGAQNPPPAQQADQRFLHREELTGDWGGVRRKWKDKGFEVASSLTQFYQGVASGGIETGSEYNGVLQLALNFDFQKLTGWKNWAAQVEAEMRFGGPLPGKTGSVNPVNTAVIVPGFDGTVFAITALNVTRIVPVHMQKGDLVVISVGRFNLLDLIDEDLFAGAGFERFFNMAQIGPLTVVRQVPLITNGLNLAYVKGGVPIVTFGVIDPNDHSTNPGFEDFYRDGASFLPGFSIPTKYFKKTGKHTFSGAITTKSYMPFDAIREILLPGDPARPLTRKAGSWSVAYTFRQYIVERGKEDGWGLFTQLSYADKSTSPITAFFDIGLGGNGLFKARSQDQFGVAFAYTDLSKVLNDNIDLLTQGGRRLRPEYQGEIFYNFYLTPWFQLTGDFQVIWPVRPIAETAIVPGARLRLVF